MAPNQSFTRLQVTDPAVNNVLQDVYNKLLQIQKALTDLEARVAKLEHP